MVLHTLQLEHAYLLLVYTLLTLVNARLLKNMQGVRLFVLYNALALLGAVAVTMRGDIPDFLSITLGNICVVGAYTALYGSMHNLFNFSRRQNLLAAAWLTLGIVSMVWLGQLHPNTRTRLLFYSATLALEQLQLAGLLLFGSRQGRRLAWMPGTLLLALGLVNIARLATVLVQGAPQDYRLAGPALAFVVLINACLQCGLMVSYVWMTTARLRLDLEVQATTDPLTGLLNRRALQASAARKLAERGRAPLSLLHLDLDRYKPINDNHGHAAGDLALIAVARLLGCGLRPRDIIARTGGDEFMALLPQTTGAQAATLADNLRRSLEILDLGLNHPDAHVTGSFGVAEVFPNETWDSLCLRCDRALYAAKGQGGNAVHTSNPTPSLDSPAELFAHLPETLA